MLAATINNECKTYVLPTPALQWTTIGPASHGFASDDFLTKFNTGNGWSGVPVMTFENCNEYWIIQSICECEWKK